MSKNKIVSTKKDVFDLLEREAKHYLSDSPEASIRRNDHMHDFRGATTRRMVEAVLVDFINHLAGGQGCDLGLHAYHVRGEEKPAEVADEHKMDVTSVVSTKSSRCDEKMLFTPCVRGSVVCPSCGGDTIWEYWGARADARMEGVEDDPTCLFCDACGASFAIQTDYDDFYCDRERTESVMRTLSSLALSTSSEGRNLSSSFPGRAITVRMSFVHADKASPKPKKKG